MSKLQNKFSVGDRVAVYEVNRWGREVMRITEFSSDGEIVYLSGSWGNVAVHPKQLRRLKAKAKPVRKPPQEIWLRFTDKGIIEGNKHTLYSVKFREVLPGEVFVTRESLAKAWDEIESIGSNAAAYRHMFSVLSEALGLEEKHK